MKHLRSYVCIQHYFDELARSLVGIVAKGNVCCPLDISVSQ